jgi:hypothetical protein
MLPHRWRSQKKSAHIDESLALRVIVIYFVLQST